MAEAGAPRRHRLRLRGLVQGVGFRPHIFALARRHGLSGFVHNDEEGVLVEAQGEAPRLQAFEAALEVELPPLARLEALEVEALPPQEGEGGFSIVPSPPGGAPPLLSVGPDMAPCKACLEELFSPAQRRFGYPFLNCTHCGPRYTVSLRMPWDRPSTSLAAFPMCASCLAEYHNPADRRFHAQPIACPACGPHVEWRASGTAPAFEGSGGLSAPGELCFSPPAPQGERRRLCRRGGEQHSPPGALPPEVDAAQVAPPSAPSSCIQAGGIVALKAAGGFQLACNAYDEAAVQRLRQRKRREAKPLAVMVPNLASARLYAHLSKAEEALLQSPERPIVLASKREEAHPPLAPSVAPGLAHLGLCLPSSPLHYVLLYEALGRPSSPGWLEEAHALAWVLTSANFSAEPLVYENEEALAQLSGVADAFALHNRPIAVALDDSVLQVAAGAPQLLRRARGYVPAPLPLPWEGPPLLAVGGHLKSTFCLVHDNRAYVSQHLGDLDSPRARASFGYNIERLCALLGLKPALLAADAHPDYFSTQWAEATGLPCLRVQHHVAHVAAVWAEHPQVPGPLLGLALDGVGLGADGLPWGGELLWAEKPERHSRNICFQQPKLPPPGGGLCCSPPQPPSGGGGASRTRERAPGGEALCGPGNGPGGEDASRTRERTPGGEALRGPGNGPGGEDAGFAGGGGCVGGSPLPPGWLRVGHVAPLPLFGGDAAAREPWRLGVAALLALGEEGLALRKGAPYGLGLPLLRAWKRGKPYAPPSSSLGRFWDAAASLLGLCDIARFEAQGPMLLEALAHRAKGRGRPLPWPLEGFAIDEENRLHLLGLLRPVVQCNPAQRGEAALWLHEVVAKALALWAAGEARRRGAQHVALSGGCLQNRLLCEALVQRLRQQGLSPLLPVQLPPNDGGLCLGQALVATAAFGSGV